MTLNFNSLLVVRPLEQQWKDEITFRGLAWGLATATLITLSKLVLGLGPDGVGEVIILYGGFAIIGASAYAGLLEMRRLKKNGHNAKSRNV